LLPQSARAEMSAFDVKWRFDEWWKSVSKGHF